MLRTFPLAAGEDTVTESPDVALVRAAIGDADAFRPLYERYMPRVHRYLLTRTGSADSAAELTQAVLVRAWTNLASFRPERGSFASWLFAIARNAASNQHRRPVPVTLDALGEGVLDPAAEPHAAAEANERAEKLRAAIARLDRGKQELLALRFAAGLSSTEIASLTGKRPDAVKKQLTRTISYLRENYRDELSD